MKMKVIKALDGWRTLEVRRSLLTGGAVFIDIPKSSVGVTLSRREAKKLRKSLDKALR